MTPEETFQKEAEELYPHATVGTPDEIQWANSFQDAKRLVHIDARRKSAAELSELREQLANIAERDRWIKADDEKPEENVSVEVFIPEEDGHVTTGMWDVSQKWVLLDEYRVPDSQVTYWRRLRPKPEDQSYVPTPDAIRTIPEKTSELQKKLYDMEGQLKALQEALDEIANPIKYMQIRAEKEGTQINGAMAIQLAKDPSYLKEIATKALSHD